MREQLEKRLDALKAEYASGQKMLTDLEVRQAELQQTMLRISGAIQVLEEMLQAEAEPASAARVEGKG
ncbi:MAG: hypothetical protein R2911_23530 [Caldilineaceae bacterium]